MDELYSTTFVSKVKLDDNRVQDARRLFEMFAEDMNLDPVEVENGIDHDISLLEVMVYMAVRCEDNIMGDGETDRTGVWLYDMLCSCGLYICTDRNYLEDFVHVAIDKIINRTYDKNGMGGLFYVNYPKQDMRLTELWYQMCWRLSELDC